MLNMIEKSDILYILFVTLVVILTIGLSLRFTTFIYYKIHPECVSSNPELLRKIVDYGDRTKQYVCDGGTCIYVCEKMKLKYNFTDNCIDVCIPSWCI